MQPQNKFVKSINEEVSVGDVVKVRVLSVDAATKKIALSMKSEGEMVACTQCAAGVPINRRSWRGHMCAAGGGGIRSQGVRAAVRGQKGSRSSSISMAPVPQADPETQHAR
jgi:transcriptional accessory protein Tex/SPT6